MKANTTLVTCPSSLQASQKKTKKHLGELGCVTGTERSAWVLATCAWSCPGDPSTRRSAGAAASGGCGGSAGGLVGLAPRMGRTGAAQSPREGRRVP